MCVGFVALVIASVGVGAVQNDDRGSGGMFGFFMGKKPANAVTTVHAEVGAQLTLATAYPATAGPDPQTDFGRCVKVAIDGRPPAATFAARAVDGQTLTGYHISGVAGQPPLTLVNRVGKNPNIEIWELSPGIPVFTKMRPVKLDPVQGTWAGFLSLGVACLPARQLLVAVHYNEPEPRDALFLYDRVSDQFRKLGSAEPDTSAGLPFRYFETLPASPDALLVRYGSDVQRLAAEVYVNRYNHVLLFSARHPRGLEVLKLAIDEGNIRRWAMVGKTLWLSTIDERKAGNPVNRVWSLDLSELLP